MLCSFSSQKCFKPTFQYIAWARKQIFSAARKQIFSAVLARVTLFCCRSVQPTPGESIKADVASLCYREHRRFHCLGMIVAVEFRPLDTEPAPLRGATRSMSAPGLGVESVEGENTAGTSNSHYNLRFARVLLQSY